MVLFSLSFHLQQDTDLPVKRQETRKVVCFHFSGIKEVLFFSLQELKGLLYKTSNNNEKRAIL